MVGPTGCGKTTALRIVAGLLTPDEGSIRIGGRGVTTARPGDRDLAVVFQVPALLPHLSVRDNVGFGLRARGVRGSTARTKIREALALLGIEDLADLRPSALSGGQAQLVALARATVRDPALFLLDEPLSNLDAPARARMRSLIRRVHAASGRSMLYVTHDQTEAMSLGDRLAVLHDGVIAQCGDPAEIFEQPADTFVARFVGSPSMNLLPLTRDDAGRGWRAGPFRVNAHIEGGIDTAVLELGVRPEHARLSTGDSDDGDGAAVIELVEIAGAESFLHLSGSWEGEVVVRVPSELRPRRGDRVCVAPEPSVFHVFLDGTRVGP